MARSIPLALFLALLVLTIVISIFFAYSRSKPAAQAPAINASDTDDGRINLVIPSNPQPPRPN